VAESWTREAGNSAVVGVLEHGHGPRAWPASR
jgi:hypothetical protein